MMSEHPTNQELRKIAAKKRLEFKYVHEYCGLVPDPNWSEAELRQHVRKCVTELDPEVREKLEHDKQIEFKQIDGHDFDTYERGE